MKIINKIQILGVVLGLMAFQSCKLESEVYDAINPSIFPTNEADVKALVTANAYSVFQNNGYGGMFNIANGILLVSDMTADYGDCSWRGWVPTVYGRWTHDTWPMNKFYDYSNNLSKMTLTLDRVDGVEMNEGLKQRYMAELRCGRGWLAFCMYDLVGPIPIADLETLKDPLAEKILPRLSEKDMQAYIETELKAAAAELPYSYKKGDANYGRFTKGLANMVLLKFYMQTKQWDKAEAIGRELTKAEYGYKLISEYKDVFSFANEKNAETIWSCNSLPGYQQHKWHAHVLPNDFPTDPGNVVKWNGYKITWDFYHTFEKGDKRLETIVSEYTGTGGVLHNEGIDVPKGEKLQYGAVPFKYEIDKTTTGEDSQIDWIIYRYADAITLLSEAIVRNGNTITQEAIDLLNQVRIRAGLPAYVSSDFKNSADFLDKLIMERGHELYFEGSRRQDLIRHGTYIETMKKKCQILGETTLINKNYERFPLPQYLINEGKGLIEQNPGY